MLPPPKPASEPAPGRPYKVWLRKSADGQRDIFGVEYQIMTDFGANLKALLDEVVASRETVKRLTADNGFLKASLDAAEKAAAAANDADPAATLDDDDKAQLARVWELAQAEQANAEATPVVASPAKPTVAINLT